MLRQFKVELQDVSGVRTEDQVLKLLERTIQILSDEIRATHERESGIQHELEIEVLHVSLTREPGVIKPWTAKATVGVRQK